MDRIADQELTLGWLSILADECKLLARIFTAVLTPLLCSDLACRWGWTKQAKPEGNNISLSLPRQPRERRTGSTIVGRLANGAPTYTSVLTESWLRAESIWVFSEGPRYTQCQGHSVSSLCSYTDHLHRCNPSQCGKRMM